MMQLIYVFRLVQEWLCCHCGLRNNLSCWSNCTNSCLILQDLIWFRLCTLLFSNNDSFTSMTSSCFQSIVAQINKAIGAEGFVSLECKSVVSNYGNRIWEYLIGEVCIFSFHFFLIHSMIICSNEEIYQNSFSMLAGTI